MSAKPINSPRRPSFDNVASALSNVVSDLNGMMKWKQKYNFVTYVGAKIYYHAGIMDDPDVRYKSRRKHACVQGNVAQS